MKILRCLAQGSGIRLFKEEHAEHLVSDFTADVIIGLIRLKIYQAWWQFCQMVRINTYDLYRTDFSPVHFTVSGSPHDPENLHGQISQRGHFARGRGPWHEWVWTGEFNLKLEGIAFCETIPESLAGMTTVRPVVIAFLRALTGCMVTLGGGASSGHGQIQVHGLEEVVAEIEKMPKKKIKLRCPWWHFTRRSHQSFGGKCKCGAIVIPPWTIPPETAGF